MPRPIPDELQGETPYGIASADFPVTFYDRPELMFGNLLRGDVDGMTRAMLAPDTLSPTQMQDVKDFLLKGKKKPSPFMKTLLEVATNPLVIIGAIAAYKFPIASTKSLLAIREGLIPKAAAMGKMVSGLHGALMNARTIPGLFDGLWGYARTVEKFISSKGAAAEKIFAKEVAKQPLSSAERSVIAARLDGLHTTSHTMFQSIRNEPEYIAFFGSSDVPIAANLQGKMSPRLISLADKTKRWFKGMWDDVYGNAAFKGAGGEAAAKKGIELGDEVESYYFRQTEYNPYYKKSLRGMSGTHYRKHLQSQYESRFAAQAQKRPGGSWISDDSFLEMEDIGAVRRGFVDQVTRPIAARRAREAAEVASSIWDDVSKAGLSATEERVEFIGRMTEYYTKGPGKKVNLVGRLGNSKQARDTLDAMAGALQDASGQGGDILRRELTEVGKALGDPARYKLDVIDAVERYTNAAAGDYGWYTAGHGKAIDTAMSAPGVFETAPHLEEYFSDGIIPHIRGDNTFPQMQRILNDATRKMKLTNWIGQHPMVRSTLGNKHTDTLVGWLNKPSSLSTASIGGQVANWFHLSTLGMNLSATSANAMQTLLTTVPQVGVQGVWRGLMGYGAEKGLLRRANDYFGFIAKGAQHPDAFRRAFPEFVEEMGEWSKTTERLLSGDVARAGYDKVFKAKGVWDKVKGAMMLPFSTTEAGNQLLAFYSGRNQHLFANATKAGAGVLSREANKVGGTLAQLTQFAGGPLGIPRSIMNMNPMWRQYMHFPMRYLAFLHGSLRSGVDPSKLDWGVIGRSLAGGTAAYIAARNMLGVDISRGLMVGALPMPGYDRGVFYPFPFVPPAASMLGEAGRSLLTGDPEGLKYSASTLVPGGVAIRRAYKSWSPKFADYQNPNEDGTIPLYNDDHSLIGSMTPMQLSMRAIGLKPMNVSAEVGAAKWLMTQRDRIRDYRRKYTEALLDNEPVQAEKVNAEFQKVYPELGPLQLKKSDIRAIRDRRQMSRIQRITKGVSRGYKPLFEQVLAEAGLSQMTQQIEQPGISGLYEKLGAGAQQQHEFPQSF